MHKKHRYTLHNISRLISNARADGFYSLSDVLSTSITGGVVNSFKPNGSTAFDNSLCLLLNITSLFNVLNS